MKLALGRRTLALEQGDITRVTADAIGNAANAQLAGGGGVDGAIHRAAGPTLHEECQKIGGCLPGSAVATGAGNLRARFVLHAVGPVWKGGQAGERETLRGAYQACLDLCDLNTCHTLALPAISTGIYGYPMEEAAEVALSTVAGHLAGRTPLETVTFVLFDRAAYDVFASTLTRLAERKKLPPPA